MFLNPSEEQFLLESHLFRSHIFVYHDTQPGRGCFLFILLCPLRRRTKINHNLSSMSLVGWYIGLRFLLLALSARHHKSRFPPSVISTHPSTHPCHHNPRPPHLYGRGYHCVLLGLHPSLLAAFRWQFALNTMACQIHFQATLSSALSLIRDVQCTSRCGDTMVDATYKLTFSLYTFPTQRDC